MFVLSLFTMPCYGIPPAALAFSLIIFRTISGAPAGPHSDGFLHVDKARGVQKHPHTELDQIPSADVAALLPRILVAPKPGPLLKLDRKKKETGKMREDWYSPPPSSAKEIPSDEGVREIAETRRTCAMVPQSVERVCSKRIIKQKSYACPSDFFPEVCTETEEIRMVDCPKLVKKEIDYDCPKMTLSKLCYKIPRTVTTICKRKTSKFVKKACPKQSQELVCRTKSVQVPDTCFENMPRDVPYSCEKAQTRLECDIDFRVDTGLCTRERTVPITYEYEDAVTERRCRTIKKPIKKTCSKEVVVDESFSCSRKVLKPKCVQVPEIREKMCLETKMKKESYPCQEVRMQQVASKCSRLTSDRDRSSLCRNQDENCNVMRKDTSSLEMYPCEKTVPVAVPSVCTREIPFEASSPCSETKLVEKCQVTEESVQDTCVRQVSRQQEYPCTDIVDAEECDDVVKKTMRTGLLRTDIKIEQYACEKPVSAEKCTEILELSPSTCIASVMKTVKRDCTRDTLAEVCEIVERTVEGTCVEEEIVDEEYLCPRLEFEEKCRTVQQWEMGRCTETVEEEVPGKCSETVPVLSCKPSDTPVDKTCFQEDEEEISFPCYDLEYKEECQDFLLTSNKADVQ